MEIGFIHTLYFINVILFVLMQVERVCVCVCVCVFGEEGMIRGNRMF